MPNDKKIHIEFAPGAFDNWDGTQEELDAFVAEIQRLAESGELEELSVPLDDEGLEELTDEEIAAIEAALGDGTQRRLQ
jgi:hypothetical protein